MDRWTLKELKETDDITFAIAILNERKSGLMAYSPLRMKLSEAAKTLGMIKEEKDAFIAKISGHNAQKEESTDIYRGDDFSNCDEETKSIILDNAERLDMVQGVIQDETEGGLSEDK